MTDGDGDLRERLLAMFDAWVPAIDFDSDLKADLARVTAQRAHAVKPWNPTAWARGRRPRLPQGVVFAAGLLVLVSLIVFGVASTGGVRPTSKSHPPPPPAGVFYYEPISGPTRLVEVDWTGRVLRTIAVRGPTDPASRGINQSPDGSQYFVGSTLFNSSGRRIGMDLGLPEGIWASENVRCADETPEFFAESTLYMASGTSPPRRVADTGGSTDHGAPVLGACDAESGRAVVLDEDFPGIIPAIAVYQLQSGQLLVSRRAPCGARSVDGSIVVSGNTQLLVENNDVCDVDTGEVVGRISGTPIGMSWDGSLVAEEAYNGSDTLPEDEVVSWRTGAVLWRIPAPKNFTGIEGSPLFSVFPEPGDGGGLVVSWAQDVTSGDFDASIWIVMTSGARLITNRASPRVL
jgi:hypothetical protein